MEVNKNPCLGCARRNVTRYYNCHSHCPDYLGLKEENEARAEMIRKKKEEESLAITAHAASVRKHQKKKGAQNAWTKEV